MPVNDLGFGDTFSNVGQLKQIVGHRLKPQEFASKRRPAVWGRGNIPTRRHEDMACPTPSPVRPAPPGRRSNVPEPVRQAPRRSRRSARSAEQTSELQSLMRTSYVVFCLKNKNDIYLMTTHW